MTNPVQHKGGTPASFTSGTSGTASVTFTSAPTAGNCLVACITVLSGPGTGSITSVKTGAAADNWASSETQAVTGWGVAAIYSCPNTGASSSTINVLVSFGGTATSTNTVTVLVDIFELSSMAASSVTDKVSGNAATTGTTFTSNATSATTQASEFWIGMAAAVGTAAITLTGPSSPWTNETALSSTVITGGTTDNCAQVTGFQNASATGTATYSGTNGNNVNWAAAVATLKAAAVHSSGLLIIL